MKCMSCGSELNTGNRCIKCGRIANVIDTNHIPTIGEIRLDASEAVEDSIEMKIKRLEDRVKKLEELASIFDKE